MTPWKIGKIFAKVIILFATQVNSEVNLRVE